MADPANAILPVLKKIQDDLSEIRKEIQAAKVRDINLADAMHDANDHLSVMHRDYLQHLGLTTQQKLRLVDLRGEVDELKARVTALESHI